MFQRRCRHGRPATPRRGQHCSRKVRHARTRVRGRAPFDTTPPSSGTLSPMASLAAELRISFPVVLENPHVVDREQVLVGVVMVGPTGQALNSSYTSRDTREYKSELGNTVANFARIVRGRLGGGEVGNRTRRAGARRAACVFCFLRCDGVLHVVLADGRRGRVVAAHREPQDSRCGGARRR